MKDVMELTKELVRIESTNPGEKECRVREYIYGYLADSGAKLELDEVEEGRCNLVATILADQQMEPAYARGEEQPMLVLICHMDTVVAGKGWTREPFEAKEIDGRIYGRGSCDMKSGLACALSVFKRTALDVKSRRSAGGESICSGLTHPIRLICTVDEEGDMTGVEHSIRSGYVKSSDWVLDLEPTNGEIQMSHKGRFWIEFSIHGITAHASRPERMQWQRRQR